MYRVYELGNLNKKGSELFSSKYRGKYRLVANFELCSMTTHHQHNIFISFFLFKSIRSR